MVKQGCMKVYNTGNYIEVLAQKRKQGFIPYETNSSIAQYNWFMSMLNPVIDFNDFEDVVLDSTLVTVDKNNKICHKCYQQELIDYYAEEVIFALSLGELKPITYVRLTSGDTLGALTVSGEFLIGEKLVSISIMANGLSTNDPEFNKLKALHEKLQRVYNFTESGMWVPVVLPSKEILAHNK